MNAPVNPKEHEQTASQSVSTIVHLCVLLKLVTESSNTIRHKPWPEQSPEHIFQEIAQE